MLKVTVRDVVYRQDRETAWLARVYAPEGQGPFPALLDVHGGAWCGGERTSNARLDHAIAASGVVVVAIDFRLGPEHAYPASIQDVNYATRWLKAHATDLNALPRPLGALGGSSGGHMAVLSAMLPRDARYAALALDSVGASSAAAAGGSTSNQQVHAAALTAGGNASNRQVHAAASGADGSTGSGGPEAIDASLNYVVACWPPIDPPARYRYAQETGRGDLVRNTEGYFRTAAAMQDGSPQTLLDNGTFQALPPTQIIQGTADGNIPLPMIERFAASYRAAGGHLELELFPDQPHGFANRAGPESERALALMVAFVRRQAGKSR